MAKAKPSKRLGMGAIPYARGTSFRVWAPHADEVYVSPEAANFIQVTGVQPDSVRGESLWFIGNNGVRFGVPFTGGSDDQSRQALGFKDVSPTPAPWSVIKWLPAGPVLSKAAAMTQHDTLMPDPNVAPLQASTKGPGQ